MTLRFRWPLPSHLLVIAALLTAGTDGAAQTTVGNPWVRATVPQQKATGAFMQLKSVQGGRLIAASSPAAGVVEIHEMTLDGNVMRMRAVAALDLPAGQAVDLKPGGYHVMLMDLKSPLSAGQTVQLTLTIEGRDGRREQVGVTAPVMPLGGSGASAPMPKH